MHSELRNAEEEMWPPVIAPPRRRRLRGYVWIVLPIFLVPVGCAIAWLHYRSPSYEATAQVLVAPVTPDSAAFTGIQVVQDSPGDPTRTIQTAASLLDSPAAATLAAQRLGAGWTRDRVAQATTVEPLGQSNIVAVTATDGTPGGAASVADAYATAALDVRAALVSGQVRARLAEIAGRLRALPPSGEAAVSLGDQRAQLEAVGAHDPSLSLAQAAVPPTTQAGVPAAAVLGVALLVAALVAAATVRGLDMLYEIGSRG
jgi:uncharacterized protein involved in exopolysaccharide biosynthesis